MRLRHEGVDISISTKEGETVVAHSLVLTAHFPKLRKLLQGKGVMQWNWQRFSVNVVEAIVNYAYTGMIDMTPQIATKLYLLAHALRSQLIVDWCTDYLQFRVNNDNITEIWLAANTTKNKTLIGVCAPLVVLNWTIFSRINLMSVNTEVMGIKEIVNCTQVAEISLKAKLNIISAWIRSARDVADSATRIKAFHDLIPSLLIQETENPLADLNAELNEVQLPLESRRLLVQTWKDSRDLIEQPIASSSTNCKTGLATENQIRLGLIELGYGDYHTYVKIIEPKSGEVVAEHKLPDRICCSTISFQNKLVFLGGYNKTNSGLRMVDSMDPKTGRLSSLHEMRFPKRQPQCASDDRRIYVLGDQLSSSSERFSNEVFDSETNEWLPLPSMIVERCGHAAVNVPNIGILVVGGKGRDDKPLRETEILTYEMNEDHEKWNWRSTVPMLQERGSPLAACFHQTVYVLGSHCNINDIEMLRVSVDDCSQWTSIKSFGICSCDFLINRLIEAGEEILFTGIFINKFAFSDIGGGFHLAKIETDPKLQLEKLKRMNHLSNLNARFLQDVVAVRLQTL